jgi:hypothetical protein
MPGSFPTKSGLSAITEIAQTRALLTNDALIVATCREQAILKIALFDRDFSQIKDPVPCENLKPSPSGFTIAGSCQIPCDPGGRITGIIGSQHEGVPVDRPDRGSSGSPGLIMPGVWFMVKSGDRFFFYACDE